MTESPIQFEKLVASQKVEFFVLIKDCIYMYKQFSIFINRRLDILNWNTTLIFYFYAPNTTQLKENLLGRSAKDGFFCCQLEGLNTHNKRN